MRLCIAPVLMLLAACSPGSRPASAAGAQPAEAWPSPIDPQVIRDQDDMTWDDYKPIPGVDWTHRDSRGTVKNVRLAIVTADFQDQPFVMTLPKKSDMYGNPQTNPIRREDVPKFFYDFYMVPGAMNHDHTIYDYWLEQSHGRVGVVTKAFGPYRMPGKVFQYGFQDTTDLPSGYKPRSLSADLDTLIRNDPAAAEILDTTRYNLLLRAYAGYDETGVWQEFGEMKFQTVKDIPKEWGNPDTTKPRWVKSRYGAQIPWNAGQWLWSSAPRGTVIQGEATNTIRHELGHAAFSIADNYNNPFAQPYRRAPVGPWDLMDRGSFNGPGGPHSRWKVPADAGGSMSAGIMLRNRLAWGFVDSSQVLLLRRSDLAKSGLAVAHVMTRVVDPLPGTLNGIHIRLDSVRVRDSTKADLTPADDPNTNPLSSGRPLYDFYTVEVVQRIGYDSYTPDNGVLIAKNKDRDRGPNVAMGGQNGYNAWMWVIDAHPEDINVMDFRRPNGERVMRAISDYRQLNDALFHAGTNSGSKYEWEDTPNRLHFYIIDVRKTDKGVLDYTLAVRSLDGAGPHARGVAINAPPSGPGSRVDFVVRNTGIAAPFNASHPTRDPLYFANDVYRLKVSVSGEGWSAALQNELAAIRFGDSQTVPVFVKHTGNASASAVITLTATSESDPAKSARLEYTVDKR
jgi:M6 family metalloprotease-like protein